MTSPVAQSLVAVANKVFNFAEEALSNGDAETGGEKINVQDRCLAD